MTTLLSRTEGVNPKPDTINRNSEVLNTSRLRELSFRSIFHPAAISRLPSNKLL
jgi:hypothetical protein